MEEIGKLSEAPFYFVEENRRLRDGAIVAGWNTQEFRRHREFAGFVQTYLRRLTRADPLAK